MGCIAQEGGSCWGSEELLVPLSAPPSIHVPSAARGHVFARLSPCCACSCSNRSFVFQIYWPPLPGQTEECFRKGKDPRVSLTHVCSALSWGGPLVGQGCAMSPHGRWTWAGVTDRSMPEQSKGLSRCMRETEARSWLPSLAMRGACAGLWQSHLWGSAQPRDHRAGVSMSQTWLYQVSSSSWAGRLQLRGTESPMLCSRPQQCGLARPGHL